MYLKEDMMCVNICDIIDIPIPISLPRKAMGFPTLMRENYIQTLKIVQNYKPPAREYDGSGGDDFSTNNWNCVFQYFGAIRVELIDIPAFDPISLR